MIHVAITDDHPAVAAGMQSMLNQKGSPIRAKDVYPDAETTLKGITDSPPDVLLLDINLPDGTGFDLCRSLLKLKPALKIIAFTSYRETLFLKNMLQAGAKGFLLKNAGLAEITTAIEVVHAGGEYIQDEMKELMFNESIRRRPQTGFIPKLTRREKEILKLILEEYTSQEIAEKLFVTSKTIETHRLNLLQKLGVRNTAGLVKIALERGLV